MIRLVQITKWAEGYRLKDVYLNPKHIVYMSESYSEKSDLLEGKMALGLDQQATFTKIKINHNSELSEIVVVGSPENIESKIHKSKKTLLRG